MLGLGRSGYAAAKLGVLRGFAVLLVDDRSTDVIRVRKKELESLGVEVIDDFKNPSLPECAFIVISPGISLNSSLGKLGEESGYRIISELEFASSFCTAPIIAISGTNGKTTVTELTEHVFNQCGYSVMAAGNIGLPLSEAALCSDGLDYIIVEVSSFQLEKIDKFEPWAAAVLNIGSDHLDRHSSIDNYRRLKFRLFENMKESARHIINKNLLHSWRLETGGTAGDPVTFSSIDEDSDFSLSGDEIISEFSGHSFCLQTDTLQLRGAHNAENIMAVLAIASICELNRMDVLKAIQNFSTSSHRLECIGESGGVKFINDSKSTNPASLVAALRAVGGNKNVCLIAGGLDKDMDFSDILYEKDKIKAIFLVGKCRNKLAKLWGEVLKYFICNSFEESVEGACSAAEPGDVVLLSPGAASMDMFENYIERGITFNKIISRRL